MAGFSAGASIVVHLLHVSGWGPSGMDWLLFVISEILGDLLIIVLFDWDLIILSSLVGSGLITETFRVDRGFTTIPFIVGVVFQSPSKKGPT